MTNTEEKKKRHRAVCAKWYRENSEQAKAASLKWHRENREKVNANCMKWYRKNLEKGRAKTAKWRRDNPEKAKIYLAKWQRDNLWRNAEQRAVKLRAIPSWADKEAIHFFYWLAKELSSLDGVLYHVDHIIPLRGKNVCGFHVENNLQVIPAVTNLRKHNSFTI